MRCVGDSCRPTKRPEAAHGLHVSSMFYYLENCPSVLFTTEDPSGNHVMCCVNRVRSKHHKNALAELAVKLHWDGTKDANHVFPPQIPQFKFFNAAECHLRLLVCLPGKE